jgi:hypothetical protein
MDLPHLWRDGGRQCPAVGLVGVGNGEQTAKMLTLRPISRRLHECELWQMCNSGQNSGFRRLQTIDVFSECGDNSTVPDRHGLPAPFAGDGGGSTETPRDLGEHINEID